MRKTFKKIAAAVMAVTTLAVGAVGMTASAANHSFWFNLGDKGSHQWSYGNPKDDDEQKAYIHTTSGSVSSVAPLYFTLYTGTNNNGSPLASQKVSNSKTISSLTGEYSSYNIYYTKWVGQNTSVYIYANSGYSGSTANGFWYS